MKQNKVLDAVAKMAVRTGEKSVGKCMIWFNQPQVPEKLKEMMKEEKK